VGENAMEEMTLKRGEFPYKNGKQQATRQERAWHQAQEMMTDCVGKYQNDKELEGVVYRAKSRGPSTEP